MSAATPTRPGARRRRGSLYVTVLGAALIVTILGLSALAAVRIQRRAAEGTNDLTAARLYAQAAIEMGMHEIENSSNWRTAKGEGLWTVDMPFGDGKLSLEVNDLGANGDLASSADTDAVLLTGTGVKGEARYKLQVTLVAVTQAATCLEVALHADNDLNFNGAVVTGDQTLSANNSVNASGASVGPAVEAVSAVNGGSYQGTQTAGITPRTMPDPVTVFDFYTDPANGTAIDYNTLAGCGGGSRCINNVVLSPASNPYGAQTSLQGIYVIDCMGQDLSIQNCRIVGTVVVLNAGSASEIRNSVNWQPAVANYPALLVEGSMDLRFDTSALSESAAKVNFNPPGTPDAGGFTDLDQSDIYPSRIAGLVYVTGDLTNSQRYPTIRGCAVVGNTFTGAGEPKFFYDSIYLNNTPPGFYAPPKLIISPGSWQQVVD